jgi:hypothetical protein
VHELTQTMNNAMKDDDHREDVSSTVCRDSKCTFYEVADDCERSDAIIRGGPV